MPVSGCDLSLMDDRVLYLFADVFGQQAQEKNKPAAASCKDSHELNQILPKLTVFPKKIMVYAGIARCCGHYGE